MRGFGRRENVERSFGRGRGFGRGMREEGSGYGDRNNAVERGFGRGRSDFANEDGTFKGRGLGRGRGGLRRRDGSCLRDRG